MPKAPRHPLQRVAISHEERLRQIETGVALPPSVGGNATQSALITVPAVAVVSDSFALDATMVTYDSIGLVFDFGSVVLPVGRFVVTMTIAALVLTVPVASGGELDLTSEIQQFGSSSANYITPQRFIAIGSETASVPMPSVTGCFDGLTDISGEIGLGSPAGAFFQPFVFAQPTLGPPDTSTAFSITSALIQIIAFP